MIKGMAQDRGRKLRFGAMPLVAALAAALAGCAGTLVELPGQGPAPRLYDLAILESSDLAARLSVPSAKNSSLRIYVAEPVAPRALNTDKIALRPSTVEIQYYKDASWSDRAPRLVQNYLIDAIDATQAVQLVAGDRTTQRGRYGVTSYLRAFDARYEGGGRPELAVNLKIVLEDRVGNKILGVRDFDARATAEGDRIDLIVEAMHRALDEVMVKAVPWILASFGEGGEANTVTDGPQASYFPVPIPKSAILNGDRPFGDGGGEVNKASFGDVSQTSQDRNVAASEDKHWRLFSRLFANMFD